MVNYEYLSNLDWPEFCIEIKKLYLSMSFQKFRLQKSLVNSIIEKTKFIENPDDVITISLRTYCILNDIYNMNVYPKCSMCGNFKKYQDITNGFKLTCGTRKCAQIHPETIAKTQETAIRNYGSLKAAYYDTASKSIKDIYGVDNISQLEETKTKKIMKSQEKYGTDYPWQTKEIQKIKANELEKKTGKRNVSQLECVKEKKRNTSRINWGTDNVFQNDFIKEKSQETTKDKYGVSNFSNSEVCLQSRLDKYFNSLLISDRLKSRCTPNFSKDSFQGVKNKYSWICNNCGKEFKDHLDCGKIPRCFNCYPIIRNPDFKSKLEEELSDFCKQFYPKLYRNIRSIIDKKELDIYIPELHLAIEFDGLFWHSEIGGKKYPDYHLEKSVSCLKKGVKLIHIFEDEWHNKKPIVQSILISKLKKLPIMIGARKCSIEEITNNDAEDFLNENHLQGYTSAEKHISLISSKKEIVSLLSVGHCRFNNNYEFEIIRFCNKLNHSIPGSLSKLFTFFVNKYGPKSIISYCDTRYGSGESYKKLGMSLLYTTKPSYYYTKDYIEKLSRFQFQKHLLKDKLPIFDANLTEWQNMQLNGYDRIWDCGNNVYTWRKEFDESNG